MPSPSCDAYNGTDGESIGWSIDVIRPGGAKVLMPGTELSTLIDRDAKCDAENYPVCREQQKCGIAGENKVI